MVRTDKVTVIIPTYERVDFFEEALQSVINQTIIPQILVIDNCSSHNKFGEILSKYTDKNIKFLKNNKNIGMFGNWNKGIKNATTEFVMILGDDDKLKLTYIEDFLKIEEKEYIDVYYTNFMCLIGEKNIKNNEKLKFLKNTSGKKLLKLAAIYGMNYPVITSCIRKSKFKKFYEKSHGSNDWLWIYRNANKLVIYGNNEIGLFYRRHLKNDSLVNSVYTRYSKIAIYLIISKKLWNEKKYIYSYLAYFRGFLEFFIMNTSNNFNIADQYNFENKSIYRSIIKKGYIKKFPFIVNLFKYKLVIFLNKTYKKYRGVKLWTS